MTDLSQRHVAVELMDSEDVPFDDYRRCLRHLEIVNRCTFAYRPTLLWLDRLCRHLGTSRSISILDVGYGHGDMLRRIAAWARHHGMPVALAGIDRNPWSARAAALSTPAHLPIRYETGDVFALPEDRAVDVVISSLFTHHLSDADLLRFLRWMDTHAKRGWFINDLHRHVLPYQTVRMAMRVLPLHRMVRHDAPVSVARAFTRHDWTDMVARSGLDPAHISIDWVFPFRYGVGYMR